MNQNDRKDEPFPIPKRFFKNIEMDKSYSKNSSRKGVGMDQILKWLGNWYIWMDVEMSFTIVFSVSESTRN